MQWFFALGRGESMIEVKQITKSFGGIKVLDAVSLTLQDSESVVLFGPSGSGKTTLLRIIAGLEVPDSGVVSIEGKQASRDDWVLEPHKRDIGFVFQAPSLWPHLNVQQNVMFGLQHLPQEQALERILDLFEQMSIKKLAQRYPNELSGGEARRVALARTIAPQPKYLLMDEPLVNLDSDLKQEMIDLIQDVVQQTKSALLYVTHDKSEANQLSKRVFHLSNGNVVVSS